MVTAANSTSNPIATEFANSNAPTPGGAAGVFLALLEGIAPEAKPEAKGKTSSQVDLPEGGGEKKADDGANVEGLLACLGIPQMPAPDVAHAAPQTKANEFASLVAESGDSIPSAFRAKETALPLAVVVNRGTGEVKAVDGRETAVVISKNAVVPDIEGGLRVAAKVGPTTGKAVVGAVKSEQPKIEDTESGPGVVEAEAPPNVEVLVGRATAPMPAVEAEAKPQIAADKIQVAEVKPRGNVVSDASSDVLSAKVGQVELETASSSSPIHELAKRKSEESFPETKGMGATNSIEPTASPSERSFLTSNLPASKTADHVDHSPMGAGVEVAALPGDHAPLSAVAFHAERLTEHLGGPDLNFTVRSRDGETVQVTTNLHERTLEVGVVADRPALVTALRQDVGQLQSQLRSHSLELGEVKVVFQGAMSMNSGLTGEHRSRQEWSSSWGGRSEYERSTRVERGNDEPVTMVARPANQGLSLLA